jgi:hypothetical protein
MVILENLNGYVTKDRMWAAVPFGKKYVSIYNGEQIRTHNTLETAKKFIQREILRKK